MSMPSTSKTASKSSKSSAVKQQSQEPSGSEPIPSSTSSDTPITPALRPVVIDNPTPGTSFDATSSKKQLRSCPDQDPKPGPSTTAAEFDLEVFDGCSSCSLEDCWCPNSSCDSSPISGTPNLKGKGFNRKGSKRIISEISDNSSEEEYSMTSPEPTNRPVITAAPEDCVVDPEQVSETVYEPASACPSEAGGASGDKDDEDEPQDEDEDATDHEPSKPSASKGPSLSPNVPFGHDAADSVGGVVQDHDNFGTDENEDSLDSLATVATNDDLSSAFEDSVSIATGTKRKNGQSTQEISVPKKKRIYSYSLRSKLCINEDGDESKPEPPKRFVFDDTPSSAGSSSISKLTNETECCVSSSTATESTSVSKRVETSKSTSTNSSSSGQKLHQTPTVTTQNQPGAMKLIPDKDNPPKEMLDWVDSFSRWSHAQRLLAIDQLIGVCEPTQVRHMMAVIEPQFRRDFISLLPKELALYVLSFLKPRDLLSAAQACRYWRILAEDNLLWREKCREAGLGDVKEVLNSRRKKPCNTGFPYSAFKLGFMREHNIECNWRTRSVRAPKVLKGHDDHVITCLQFCNNKIVSGSDDNTLKVWNASTGRCLRTLVGHTGGVWSSQMEGNTIVSGSTDRTLKVWNAETGQCQHTLYGHTSTVRCMHLHESLCVSGSRDATLRMWDIESGECLHVLMGHVAAVRCVQYDGRLVVSGAYDYMVKVWNPLTEECLHTLTGHTNRVYSLQFDGVHVVSGSLDTSIRVWDVETGSCKHALMGHQSLTSGMELKDNILVSGNADSTVKVWDITTGQCLQTLSGTNKHQSAVTCLQFNSKFVITSSDDGTVKLWDLKTGEFIRDLVALKSGGSGGVVWRIRANSTKLVCAVGSRSGAEETKLLVLDFDVYDQK